MSDRDYGILLHAAGWIERHADVDAPAYPEIGRMSRAIEDISKRRSEGASEHVSHPASSARKISLYLLEPNGTGAPADASAQTNSTFRG